MEMIAHQTERMDLPFGLRTGFAQRRQKQSAILLVALTKILSRGSPRFIT
jgi:hypothetical protein